MKTHFIKGTNNQYSIREDGKLIRHFRLNYKKEPVYNNVIIKGRKVCSRIQFGIRINEKRVEVTQQSLLIIYFGSSKCTVKGCNNKIYKLYKYHCEKCISLNCKQSMLKSGEKARKVITKAIVSKHLRIPVKDLNDELYQLYKITLKTKRVLSKKTGIPTNLIR